MSDHEYQGEWSVYQFFQDEPGDTPDSNYECVRKFVSPEEAAQSAKHYCSSVATRLGLTRRVIITDGGDSIAFEWEFGKGVTFPTQEISK